MFHTSTRCTVKGVRNRERSEGERKREGGREGGRERERERERETKGKERDAGAT